MGLLLLIGFSYLIGLVAWIFIRDRLDPRRKIPGGPLLDPFFGVLFLIGVLYKGRIIRPMLADLKAYGPVRRSYLFLGQIRIMVSDPEALKHILVVNAKNYTRGAYAGVEFIEAVVGESGLILISGERHKRLRRVASPAFRPSALKSFFPLYHLGARRLINLWLSQAKEAPGATVCLKTGLSYATLDVIGLAAFGYDFNSFDSTQSLETQAIQRLTGGGISLLAILPFYKQIFKLKEVLTRFLPRWMMPNAHAVRTMRELVHNIVEQRRTAITAAKDQTSAVGRNLLDYTIASEEAGNVSSTELEDMVMTFMLAGHETSSVGLSWTLLLLAKNPEWQTKCQEEADALFAKIGEREVEWEDTKELGMIEACVKESLRLFPPIPYVSRRNVEADRIGGQDLPPATELLLVSLELHRNPLVWGQDAHVFNPARFLENAIEEGTFMPFGDGVHKCIGYQFSLNEMIVFLAHLLHNITFALPPNVRYAELADISLKPNPPLSLTLTPRD